MSRKTTRTIHRLWSTEDRPPAHSKSVRRHGARILHFHFKPEQENIESDYLPAA